ncbi:phage integrase N-terminal SAM-like domain-containing protein [Motilimonas cestriensis]|uniref:Phage integrase N-terminal SAM-like domain-containing protein n=1 Tax=Motilimonas cestriensis TaxID=2742685 RepID=A0ABS8W3J5_9GAMM|nr:phage integrase N-terminal SAM-like domain-containing protein [Motilimonas cestriensis]
MAKSPFIESIRADLRARRYSLQTEKTYLFWIRQFIYFHHMRTPMKWQTPKDRQSIHQVGYGAYLSPFFCYLITAKRY